MTRKAGNGISRGLKPVSSAGGIGLPRLKPGPISEAKANAGVLRYAQDDKRKTGNRRSFDSALLHPSEQVRWGPRLRASLRMTSIKAQCGAGILHLHV